MGYQSGLEKIFFKIHGRSFRRYSQKIGVLWSIVPWKKFLNFLVLEKVFSKGYWGKIVENTTFESEEDSKNNLQKNPHLRLGRVLEKYLFLKCTFVGGDCSRENIIQQSTWFGKPLIFFPEKSTFAALEGYWKNFYKNPPLILGKVFEKLFLQKITFRVLKGP